MEDKTGKGKRPRSPTDEGEGDVKRPKADNQLQSEPHPSNPPITSSSSTFEPSSSANNSIFSWNSLLIDVLKADSLRKKDFKHATQIGEVTLKDWAEYTEDVKRENLFDSFPGIFNDKERWTGEESARERLITSCIGVLNRATTAVQAESIEKFIDTSIRGRDFPNWKQYKTVYDKEKALRDKFSSDEKSLPIEVKTIVLKSGIEYLDQQHPHEGESPKPRMEEITSRIVESSELLRINDVHQLRAKIDSTISHLTEQEYKTKLGTFALNENVSHRKYKSFAMDGTLRHEGIFLNGITTEFDRSKDEQVVEPFLKLSRSGSRASQVLLAKSGTGKTYTWYRMCSIQDREGDDLNLKKMFLILLSSPGAITERTKEYHSGTLEPIFSYDREIRVEEPSKKHWDTAHKMTTHLIDAHLSVLRHLRSRMPEITPLDFLKLQMLDEYQLAVRTIVRKGEPLSDEERDEYNLEEKKTARFSLVFDEVQQLVKGKEKNYVKGSNKHRTLASPILTACANHPQFTLHAYSGSDYALSDLKAVLSDIGGEHASLTRVRSVPQFEKVDQIWNHMQYYVDLSGCDRLKELLGLVIGRPRMTAMVLTWLAREGNTTIKAIEESLTQYDKWSDKRNRIAVIRKRDDDDGDDDEKLYFSPFDPTGEVETDNGEWRSSTPTNIELDVVVVNVPSVTTSEAQLQRVLKPALFAIAIREVFNQFKSDLEGKMEKFTNEIENGQERAVFQEGLLAIATASLFRSSIQVRTVAKVDMLGLGLGAWHSSDTNNDFWTLDERVVFAAIRGHISSTFAKGELMMNGAMVEALCAISGNSSVSSKGGPVEHLIAAAFVNEDMMGEKFIKLPFISVALGEVKEDENTIPQIASLKQLLRTLQYGSKDQELLVGTRKELANKLFTKEEQQSGCAKSDISFIEATVSKYCTPRGKPTVIVLHPSIIMGPDIVVLVLNSSPSHPHIEIRVGVKSTIATQVKPSERKGNAVTTLLQGAYTRSSDGVPARHSQTGNMLEAVAKYDSFYGLPIRESDSVISHDGLPTSGNLPLLIRLRVELSSSTRKDGTPYKIFDDGKVIDVILDRNNLDRLILEEDAIEILKRATTPTDVVYLNM